MADIPQIPPAENTFQSIPVQQKLQSMTEEELLAYADQLSKTSMAIEQGVTKDELVSYLKEMQAKGIQITPETLDNLLAKDPVLDPPKVNIESLLTYFGEKGGGNPFLRASLLTVFTMVFLEVTAQMAEIALQEAFITANTILILKDIGLYKASLKMRMAEAESAIARAAAQAALISMIVSIAAVGLPLLGGAAGKFGGKGFFKTFKATSMFATPISQIGSAYASWRENITKAFEILQKGKAESEYEFYNTLNSAMDRRMQAAIEAMKDFRELISKFLDALKQLSQSIQTSFGINPEKNA